MDDDQELLELLMEHDIEIINIEDDDELSVLPPKDQQPTWMD